jgi:hypothetical protein
VCSTVVCWLQSARIWVGVSESGVVSFRSCTEAVGVRNTLLAGCSNV